jgi:nucleoside-diphosphate-sugar epimerase
MTIDAVRRGWSPVPGPGASFLSSVALDDAATAVVAALAAPAGVYNVVEDEPVRRREYADALAAPLGVSPPRLLPAAAAWALGSLGEMLSRSLRISNRKLRAATGWAPRYPNVHVGWPAVLRALAT